MAIPSPNDCVTKLVQQVAASFPAESWKDSKVIVAVSGGPDSVALAHLMVQIAKQNALMDNLIIAHCNHQTGEHCEYDEQFVKELASNLGLRFIAVRRDRYVEVTNSEEALRDFRYQALIEIAQQSGARYLVTGHTKDDQIETILFRLCRGTGVWGLRGILPIRVAQGISVIRPMLEIERDEILELLSELNQTFCSDPSNSSSHYTRNFLRNEVIPLIEKRFGEQFRHSFMRISEQSLELEDFLNSISKEWIEDALGPGRSMNVSQIRLQDDVIVRHAMKLIWKELGYPEQEMNRDKWMMLGKLIKSDIDGVLQFPGQITVRKISDTIHFEQTQTTRSVNGC